MIRHVVLFTVPDTGDVERARDGLMTLADIPHASHFEVGRNLCADTLTDAHADLVVYAEFADEDALAAYKAHPLYQRAIEIVKPLREMRIAADFEAA